MCNDVDVQMCDVDVQMCGDVQMWDDVDQQMWDDVDQHMWHGVDDVDQQMCDDVDPNATNSKMKPSIYSRKSHTPDSQS